MVSHSFNKNAPVSNAVLELNVNCGDLFDGSDDIPAASDDLFLLLERNELSISYVLVRFRFFNQIPQIVVP